MKKVYFTAVLITSAFLSFSQSSTQLDANNANATINDNGFFFNDYQNSIAGYEIPAGSDINAIFSGSFWFGGTDVNGQLKLAAQQYYGNGQDYWWGPIARLEAEFTPVVQNYFGQSLWTVTKAEIDDHILNYQSSTYTMPADIMNWPAHGDTSLGSNMGMLPFIAPFVDANNNGTYDPENGDYPCIKGDEATYLIMNDKGGLHTASGGEPVGIQLHYMFYQFNSVPELENTTFVDIEVVNMGTQTLFDTKASFYLDTDLGNPMDDFIGTDTLRNMVYTYNADNFDEDAFGSSGYGANPPALGIKWLSHDLAASISYVNGASFPMTNPVTSRQHYQAMIGNYQDSTDQLDDLGTPTDYTYSGDPNISGSWSEIQQGNTPGDRRLLTTVDVGNFTWDDSYGAVLRETFSFALVYAQGTDHLNSVTELQSLADFVQNHFDSNQQNCFNYQLADIQETSQLEFSVIPNPNNGSFIVQLPEVEAAKMVLFNSQGKVVLEQSVKNGANPINVELQSGIYYLTITSNSASTNQKVIIR